LLKAQAVGDFRLTGILFFVLFFFAGSFSALAENPPSVTDG
jgi:hypothetical protein